MVIHTLYDQQLEMYQQRSHRCAERIVSISQPPVQPIVRGKASQRVEFGAKISASLLSRRSRSLSSRNRVSVTPSRAASAFASR